MTPEEEFERNRQIYENRCWVCNGRLHRFQTSNPADQGMTDCRDYLPAIRVRCEGCGSGYRRQRQFVLGGFVPAEEINRLIEQFGWPIPDCELPALESLPTPPTIEEIRARRSE